MTARTAKVLSRSILVAAVAMLAIQFTLMLGAGDRLASDHLVVIGDPNAPGMAAVKADMLRGIQPGDRFGEIGTFDLVFGGIAGAIVLIWSVTGSLIVSRQPRNVAGWIFCAGAATVALNGSASAYTIYSVKLAARPLPAQGLVALMGEYSFVFVAFIPLLVLLFPDGHPPSPRWRWATRVLLAGFGLAVIVYALTPGPLNNLVDAGILYANPFGVNAFAEGRPANALVGIGAFLMLGAGLSTVVAVWQRFRRTRGDARQQMRWLVAVATFAGVGLAGMLLMFPLSLFVDVEEGPDWLWLIFFLPTALAIFIGIPAAYLVAIFRYRLWELDVVIKKTVVFAVVAAALTLLALLVVLVLPVATVGIHLSGWEWGLLAFGIAVGMLFGPLRRLGRGVADRIVYRKRATPYEVLTTFSERIGETYSTEDILPRMVQVLARGTGATSARVLLRVGGDVREMARWPDDGDGSGDEHVVPVTHLGEELGALAVRMPANDPMDPSKEKLVADLAAQTGLVLRNVRLIEDLRASRQRLVAAQDEERRKLERNIHDGAQQQLVALQVKQRVVEGTLERDPARAKEMLSQLQAETATALEDLRDLARGIYPPLLADEGLPAALEAQARKSPVPVVVDPDGIGRFPQEIEAAVYFCTLEALNNVAKYAEASHVTITLSQENGRLTFSVTDDGRGFDPSKIGYGTGLQGMADRLDAIGGELEVETASGSGTTVRGRIPTGWRSL